MWPMGLLFLVGAGSSLFGRMGIREGIQFFEHLLNENRVNLSIAMSGSNLITATKCAYKLNIAKITTNYLNALTIGIWVLYSNLHKANESNSISDSLIVIL